jgi:hypothetical protein
MLAAMTSLASLVHTAHQAAPAFNGLFYATVATVIPVLFLAIAVQGNFYDDLLSSSARAIRTFRARQQGPAAATALVASAAAYAFAVVILIYSVYGEVDALQALYWQKSNDPGGALEAASLLAVLTFIVVPAVTLVRVFRRMFPPWMSLASRVRRQVRVQRLRRRLYSAFASTRPAGSEPETGKRDGLRDLENGSDKGDG